jgi:hypothetical protein
MNAKRFCFLFILALGACYEDPVVSENSLVFTTSSQQAPADGLSTIEVELQLIGVGNAFGQTVKLTTTLGTLANGEKSQALKTDQQGRATTTLRSSAAGAAILEVNYKDLLIMNREVEFTKEILKVTLDEDVVEANSLTPINVTAELKGTKALAGRTIEFTTTVGTFENGESTMTFLTDSTGIANVRITSSRFATGTLIVNAQGELVQRKNIEFVVAEPEKIIITTPGTTFYSGSANAIPVTFELWRSTGKPSDGLSITVMGNEYWEGGSQVGIFSNPVVNGNKITYQFAIPNPLYSGVVIFQAHYSGISVASGYTYLNFVPSP